MGLTDKPPVYTITDIMAILPHRYPFLLVDCVTELSIPESRVLLGRKISAIKNVTFNEPFFPGHFPHRPVMPGVLQVEALAQVAALSCIDPKGPAMDVAIAGINEARFRRPVGPGDTLEMTAEVTRERGQIIFLRCEARVRGHIVCETEILAKMFPREVQS